MFIYVIFFIYYIPISIYSRWRPRWRRRINTCVFSQVYVRFYIVIHEEQWDDHTRTVLQGVPHRYVTTQVLWLAEGA